MSKLNIALIGAGRRGGGAHLPVIDKLKDVYNLVAICDIDQAVAQQYAEQYGANPYTNVRDLVAHEKTGCRGHHRARSRSSRHRLFYGRCRCEYYRRKRQSP